MANKRSLLSILALGALSINSSCSQRDYTLSNGIVIPGSNILRIGERNGNPAVHLKTWHGDSSGEIVDEKNGKPYTFVGHTVFDGMDMSMGYYEISNSITYIGKDGKEHHIWEISSNN